MFCLFEENAVPNRYRSMFYLTDPYAEGTLAGGTVLSASFGQSTALSDGYPIDDASFLTNSPLIKR